MNLLQKAVCVLVCFVGSIRCKDYKKLCRNTENLGHIIELIKSDSSLSIFQQAKIVFRKTHFRSQFLLGDLEVRPDLFDG